MRSLLIIATLVLSVNAMAADTACNITLGVKKDGAKSAKLNGVSFSTKQIDALKSICTVNLERMNDEQLIEDFKAALKRKHDKEAKAASN